VTSSALTVLRTRKTAPRSGTVVSGWSRWSPRRISGDGHTCRGGRREVTQRAAASSCRSLVLLRHVKSAWPGRCSRPRTPTAGVGAGKRRALAGGLADLARPGDRLAVCSSANWVRETWNDGNGDGNPGRRARLRLNGDERTTRTDTAAALHPLHLESESRCLPAATPATHRAEYDERSSGRRQGERGTTIGYASWRMVARLPVGVVVSRIESAARLTLRDELSRWVNPSVR
jgi:hypothetical protein